MSCGRTSGAASIVSDSVPVWSICRSPNAASSTPVKPWTSRLSPARPDAVAVGTDVTGVAVGTGLLTVVPVAQPATATTAVRRTTHEQRRMVQGRTRHRYTGSAAVLDECDRRSR